jgi:hypothetical protein
LDEPIFISIKREHHFTVLPLSASGEGDVALLQGFQGMYTLSEWLRWGTVRRTATEFLALFNRMLENDEDAATDLFAIEGTEDRVRQYFRQSPSSYSLAAILTRPVDLFAGGGSTARLAL